MVTPQMAKSLFLNTNTKERQSLLLNKRQIVSAKQTDKSIAEVKMASGETFEIITDFGDLIYMLQEIEHKNDFEAKS